MQIQVELNRIHQNGKKCEFTNFDCGMVVSARQAHLSNSGTADVINFLCKTVSRLYTELCKKQKTSNEWQFCMWKCLDGERGAWADWFKLTGK